MADHTTYRPETRSRAIRVECDNNVEHGRLVCVHTEHGKKTFKRKYAITKNI